MRIVHEHTAVPKGASAHREGGIRFLSLLQGAEDTPGNFHLMLVYADDFDTPRHRHNFDQLRIVLEGRFGFDRGQVQEAGMLGYFPEGTWYTQKAEGHSVTLLLQMGGASGLGYLSDRQLRGAVDALQTLGRFEGGVFRRADGEPGPRNQDGYEAAWEFVRGRSIAYPEPCYDQPVLWRAERFAWRSSGQAGVAVRRFGEFAGNGLRVEQVRVQAGAHWQVGAKGGAKGGATLFYCLEGLADAQGERLRPVSAVHLEAGEAALVRAEADSVFYRFGLMHAPA